MSTGPLVSVVMPSYQQAGFLAEAVRSVLDQEGAEIELLVMDPGSTDGSRELLRDLREEYGERLTLSFQPDKGQSDAVNIGMGQARGRILGWLNSDDRLRPGALAKVIGWLDSPEPRWVYGQAGIIDAEGRARTSLIVRYKKRKGRRFSRLKLLTENFVPQMAVFWNRALWDLAGGLDLGKHLDMDYDLWLRFARVAAPLVFAEELADFRVHGGAKGSRHTAAQLRAAFATARQHAKGLGWQEEGALLLHRLFAWRNRVVYAWLKPRIGGGRALSSPFDRSVAGVGPGPEQKGIKR